MLFKVIKSNVFNQKMTSSVLSSVFFFKLMLTRLGVRYLIFHLLFLLKNRLFFLYFACLPSSFFCHYYLRYVYLRAYKKPPLGLWHSSTQNQFNETPEEIIDEQKLWYIASQINIWDYFAIPQANYLALDKNEKSRMLGEIKIILVLKLVN